MNTFNPFVDDPPVDHAHPAATRDVRFESHGARLNGVLHVANGPGPHPIVILFHGFPGNERNFDLAHLWRRAGFNTLVFHYRGSWHSEGVFTFTNAIADADAALDFVLSDTAATNHRIDRSRIAVAGHSLGGHIALAVAGRRVEVKAAIGLATVNLGWLARTFPDEAARASWAVEFEGECAPLTGASGAALIDEIWRNRDALDVTRNAAALARTPVALLQGTRDGFASPPTMHEPLLAALRAQGCAVTDLRYDADHSFASHRAAIARDTLTFLQQTLG